jgi:hypothetical protein
MQYIELMIKGLHFLNIFFIIYIFFYRKGDSKALAQQHIAESAIKDMASPVRCLPNGGITRKAIQL